MAKKKAKKTSIGFLVWMALILLIIVVILSKQDEILETIAIIKENKSNQEKSKTISEKEEDKEKEKSLKNILSFLNKKEKNNKELNIITNKPSPSTKKIEEQKIIAEPTPSTKKTPIVTAKKRESKVIKEKIPKKKIQPKPQEKKIIIKEGLKKTVAKQNYKTRRYMIYFLLPDDNSPLKIQGIERQITFIDSPLTATLNELFEGIKASEFNRYSNLISSIPQGSKIQSLKVVNGVAFLSLNTKFTLNAFSKEGVEASLKQIVYTTTEFPTVNSVQFLINNKKQEYLSAEGGYIASPLSRSSFQ